MTDSTEVTLTELLWDTTLNGFHDDEGGSATEGPMWYGLVLLDEDHTYDDSCPVEEFRGKTIPAGYYIIMTDSQGFISHEEYDSKDEARETFDAYVAAVEED